MSGWSKTPPSEPGWYWMRATFMPGTERHQAGAPFISCGYVVGSIRWRTTGPNGGNVLTLDRPEWVLYEWWPIPIQPPEEA